MNAKAETSSGAFNTVKWIVAIAVMAAAVVGNWYYAEWPLIYRVLCVVALVGFGLAAASTTTAGASLIELIKGSRTEVRKVVWPTHQETTQTTLIVVAGVLIMALLLWGLDSLLGWLASLIIG
jgi:preprotein translocase subunit SecE